MKYTIAIVVLVGCSSGISLRAVAPKKAFETVVSKTQDFFGVGKKPTGGEEALPPLSKDDMDDPAFMQYQKMMQQKDDKDVAEAEAFAKPSGPPPGFNLMPRPKTQPVRPSVETRPLIAPEKTAPKAVLWQEPAAPKGPQRDFLSRQPVPEKIAEAPKVEPVTEKLSKFQTGAMSPREFAESLTPDEMRSLVTKFQKEPDADPELRNKLNRNVYFWRRLSVENFGENLQAMSSKSWSPTTLKDLNIAVQQVTFMKTLDPTQFKTLSDVITRLHEEKKLPKANEDLYTIVTDGHLLKSLKDKIDPHNTYALQLENMRPEHAQRLLDELPGLSKSLSDKDSDSGLKREKLDEIKKAVIAKFPDLGAEKKIASDVAVTAPEPEAVAVQPADVVVSTPKAPDASKPAEVAAVDSTSKPAPTGVDAVRQRLASGLDRLKNATTDLGTKAKDFLDKTIILSKPEIAALGEHGLVTKDEWESFKKLPGRVLSAIRSEIDRVPITREARIRSIAESYGLTPKEVDAFITSLPKPAPTAVDTVRQRMSSGLESLKKMATDDVPALGRSVKKFLDDTIILNKSEIAAVRKEGLLTPAERRSLRALPARVKNAIGQQINKLPAADMRAMQPIMLAVAGPKQAAQVVSRGIRTLFSDLKMPEMKLAEKRKALKDFVETNLAPDTIKDLARGSVTGMKNVVRGLSNLPNNALAGMKSLMTKEHKVAMVPVIKKLVADDASKYQIAYAHLSPDDRAKQWVTDKRKEFRVLGVLGDRETLVKSTMEEFGISRARAEVLFPAPPPERNVLTMPGSGAENI